MAESKHERVAEALRVRLATIVADAGVTYWYTPSVVARVHHFEDTHLDQGSDVVYLLRAGDEFHSEKTTQHTGALAQFFLLVAKRFAPPLEGLGTADAKLRLTIVNRMVRDVIKVLLAEPTLGGLVENVMDESERLTVDRSLVFKGYSLAELRWAVSYDYTLADA